MWVFGYGSLMWKADFPFQKKLVGCIKGYDRRFWQGSEDHRGIPGKPGRVVTLVPSSDFKAKVWGVAYKIADSDVTTVKAYLDFREKDGYKLFPVTFYPKDLNESSFELSIYVADERNPFYLGPAPLKEIAKQILKAEGPSGKNIDYLFRLANTMRTILPGECDPHLFELEVIARNLMEN